MAKEIEGIAKETDTGYKRAKLGHYRSKQADALEDNPTQVILSLQQTYGNRYVQRLAEKGKKITLNEGNTPTIAREVTEETTTTEEVPEPIWEAPPEILEAAGLTNWDLLAGAISMASHHAWAEPPNWQVVAKLSAEAGNRVNNFLGMEGLSPEVKGKMGMVQRLLFDAFAGAEAMRTDGQTVRMNVDRAHDLARQIYLPR